MALIILRFCNEGMIVEPFAESIIIFVLGFYLRKRENMRESQDSHGRVKERLGYASFGNFPTWFKALFRVARPTVSIDGGDVAAAKKGGKKSMTTSEDRILDLVDLSSSTAVVANLDGRRIVIFLSCLYGVFPPCKDSKTKHVPFIPDFDRCLCYESVCWAMRPAKLASCLIRKATLLS